MNEFFTNWTNYLILIIGIVSTIALLMTLKSRKRSLRNNLYLSSKDYRNKMMHDPELRYRYQSALEDYPP